VDKLLGDEYYSSEKLEALGFKAVSRGQACKFSKL